MEKQKVDLKEFAANTGKNAAALIGKAKKAVIEAVDQNDDGEFTLADINIVADQLGEKKALLKMEADRKSLCPIFEEDLNNPEFTMSKLIRITQIDKKHPESAACKGSIGYESVQKGIRVITIYPDKAKIFGLSFFPDIDSEVYYIDPSDRDKYIALDDYFSYLKIARIGELQRVAQELGATHFRVKFMEQKKSFTQDAAKAKANVKAPQKQGGAVDASFENKTDNYSKVEIASEMNCIGHEPNRPKLEYFKNDPQIQSLIDLRMNDNTLTHQIYTLSLISSSGVKIKDAIKIDAALSAMKISGNATFVSEAQSEMRRFFEYEIDF